MSLLNKNSTPAERARGCVFAENFESQALVEQNGGTVVGAPGLDFGGGIPELDEHMSEIGHCIESKTAGTNVLAKIIMHFN